MKLTNTIILVFILLVASVLRFYHFFEIPYTHDEFSALFRTHFGSFSELIERGVKIDGHPAGVQVFLYYWTKVFGSNAWIVKLPFILEGITSVFFIYLIGKEWYHETTALIAAAFMASIQFMIMYSQIARPYSSGLCFSLLMVYFWSKIIHTPPKNLYVNCFLFSISAALCAYNHYFSFLFAFIVGLSGLFFISKKYLVPYLLSGILILLLFIPHMELFLYQLHQGGVEEWLGKPHWDFFIKYVFYIFNFSIYTCVVVLGLILYGGSALNKIAFPFHKLLLFSCWFIIPIIIGFVYSTCVNSVLQYSVLIFSTPYLFFILFGHLPQQSPKTNLFIVLIILSVNCFAVIKERQHYSLFYTSQYKQMLLDHQQAENRYGVIPSIIDSNNKIIEYYSKQLNLDTNFRWFRSFPARKDFIDYLDKQSQRSSYLYLGCSSVNDPVTIPIIEDYFPTIVTQNNYAGGTTLVFSKLKHKVREPEYRLNLESRQNKFWTGIDSSRIKDTLKFSGEYVYTMDNRTEWAPAFSHTLKDLINNRNNFIDISVKAYLPGKFNDIILVAELDAGNKSIFWSGTSFDSFITQTDTTKGPGWITVHNSLKMSDIYINYPHVLLKSYIWNKGKHHFYFNDFSIRVRKGNSVIYGLNERI